MMKISAIFSAMIMAATFTMTAYAEDAPADCKDYKNFFDNAEFEFVIEQTRDDNFMKDIGYTTADAQSNSRGSNIIGEYKEYTAFDDHEFFEGLANGTSINELVPDEYIWVIPSGEYTAEVRLNDEGEWYTACIGRDLINKSGILGDTVRFDTVNSAIEQLGGSANVEDVICVNLPLKNIRLVCIVSDTTYVIPFCARPDFTKFESGKLYTAAQAYDIWSKEPSKRSEVNAAILNGRNIDELTLDEILSLELGGAGTGTEAQPEPKSEMPVIPIIIIPAVFIAAAITVTILAQNKNSRKRSK